MLAIFFLQFFQGRARREFRGRAFRAGRCRFFQSRYFLLEESCFF